MRIFDAKTGKVQRRINKATYPVDQASPLYNKQIRLFLDDTLMTFSRRLCYSPDGNLLYVQQEIEIKQKSSCLYFYRFVPTGCTDVIPSSTETAEKQNENKDVKDDAVEKFSIKDEVVVKVEKVEEDSVEKSSTKEEADEKFSFKDVVVKEEKVENDTFEKSSAKEETDEKSSAKDEEVVKMEKVEKTVKLEKSEKPVKLEKQDKLQNVTYIFTRYSKQPAVVIPSDHGFTIAVRCCPTVFKLRPYNENCPPIIDLPYRMIYAIASKNSVLLYDTQQRMPFGSISKIHYARLTDVTWSNDGRILIVSSFDGFCTLISFEEGELGEVYDQPINMVDTDDKENQSSKKKRYSNDGKNKTSPKDQKSEKTEASTPTTLISTKDTAQLPILEIPGTIIASVETFESPEYKEKQATPIAVRRAPRTNPSTPSSATATPKSSETDSAMASSKKPKLIAVRRQPRNILPSSPMVVEKSAGDQDEAMDAWPIPIDAVKTEEDTEPSKPKEDMPIMILDETEDMHLVYEGESELTLIKTETINEPIAKQINTPGKPTSNNSASESSSSNEQNGTPDTKNSKTPRRVQLRTISTPKSKKKLIN